MENGVHWRDRTYQFLQQAYPEIDKETFDRVDRAAVDRLIDSRNAPQLSLRETMDVIATGIYEGLGLDPEIKDQYVDFFCAGHRNILIGTGGGSQPFEIDTGSALSATIFGKHTRLV